MARPADLASRPHAAVSGREALPTASLLDTAAAIIEIVLPTLAKGPIIRRPRMVAFAERWKLDDRAVRRMQRLRRRYGPGPLMLRLPFRSQAVLLEHEHVRRVLDASPDPFTTASDEKRTALAHFEPKGALITRGPERAPRRRFNEVVLEAGRPVHRLADSFVQLVQDQADRMLAQIPPGATLTWSRFAETWFRVVRGVVFGAPAVEDRDLTGMIDRLRSHGNWGFLRPRHDALRQRFFSRMEHYVGLAAPGSLASIVASMPDDGPTAPLHQIPQWLFAFDPAGMTTYRTLALLASHREAAERARDESACRPDAAGELPFLRGCVLESLRLWPTTPFLLRQSTRDTVWEHGVMPAGTGILIFAPFFHRDEERLPFAHTFTPDLWRDQAVFERWPLVPFSAGPAVCPGRHVVLLAASTMIAAVLGQRHVRPASRPLDRSRLPGTLNHYALDFVLERATGAERTRPMAPGGHR